MRLHRSSSVPDRSATASAADRRESPLGADDFAALMASLGPFEPRPLLACAVSGGTDSLASLALAAAWADARGGQVMALTVDHGLRPEAAEEARHVGEVARRLGAGHRTLIWRDPPRSGAVQAAARAARLRLLTEACRELGCLHLLLAHHHDDQLETFLLRLSAKSDLDGLAAMSPLRRFAGVRLLRPFLTIPRKRLEATLEAAELAWVEDPSNRDPRHERVRLRQLLAGPELPRAELAEAADTFRRLRRITEQEVARRLAEAVAFCPGGYAVLYREALVSAPEPIARRMLSRVLQSIGGADYPPRGGSLGRLLGRLTSGPPRTSTLGRCRLGPHGQQWLVVRETGRDALLPIRPGETKRWKGRFQLFLSPEGLEDLDPAGFSVAALGEADRSSLIRPPEGAPETAIPGPARAALPALRYLDAVVAVPHLKQYQRGFDRALRVSAAEFLLSATRLDFTLLTQVGILPRESGSS